MRGTAAGVVDGFSEAAATDLGGGRRRRAVPVAVEVAAIAQGQGPVNWLIVSKHEHTVRLSWKGNEWHGQRVGCGGCVRVPWHTMSKHSKWVGKGMSCDATPCEALPPPPRDLRDTVGCTGGSGPTCHPVAFCGGLRLRGRAPDTRCGRGGSEGPASRGLHSSTFQLNFSLSDTK